MNKKQALGISVIGALALVILLLTVTGVRAEPDATLLAAPTIPAAQADVVSPTISYQGRLLDGEDNPVDGTTVMTFSLYAGATGGSPLWQDRLNVPVNEGLFDVILAVNPALFDGQALWLGGGRSGVTATPAVAAGALRLPRPHDALVRPDGRAARSA